MTYPAPVPAPPTGGPLTYGFVPTAPATVQPDALPNVPREYHEFYWAPKWRWWRPPLALLAAAVGWFVVALAVEFPLILTSVMSRGEILEGRTTPVSFLVNNALIAVFIPAAVLAQWLVVRQRPGWLSSVVGRLRWRWLFRCLLVVLPLWIAISVWEWFVAPPQLQWLPTTWLMIVGILLTTPLQCAGEEYSDRGLTLRVVAGLIPHRWIGLAVGSVASSLVFMLMHGAGDPWLNLFYFEFGMIACYLTWRTGGLEASIAMHVVNNMTSEIFMPFTDISGTFDRGAGAVQFGFDVVLILVLPLVAAALMVWQARVKGIRRSAAPGGFPPPWQSVMVRVTGTTKRVFVDRWGARPGVILTRFVPAYAYLARSGRPGPGETSEPPLPAQTAVAPMPAGPPVPVESRVTDPPPPWPAPQPTPPTPEPTLPVPPSFDEGARGTVG